MKSVRIMFTVFITCVLLISDSHLVNARVLPSTELAYQPFVEPQAVAVNPYENIEQAEYHIRYELNGGKRKENNSDTILESELPFTLEIPKREGYNFAGWYTDSHFTNKITKNYPCKRRRHGVVCKMDGSNRQLPKCGDVFLSHNKPFYN